MSDEQKAITVELTKAERDWIITTVGLKRFQFPQGTPTREMLDGLLEKLKEQPQ